LQTPSVTLAVSGMELRGFPETTSENYDSDNCLAVSGMELRGFPETTNERNN